MWQWWERFDQAVIERVCEPVATWIERLTGFTNFMVARFLFVVWLAHIFAGAIQATSMALVVLWVGIGLMMTLFAPVQFWLIRQAERESEKSPTCRNIEKIRNAPVRAFQFSIFVIFSPHVFFSGITPGFIGLLAMWLHYCFLACDRPPPQEEREPLFARPAYQGGR